MNAQTALTNALTDPLTPAQAAARTVPVAPAAPADNQAQSRFAEEADRAARYRLVIEEGAEQGSFIYKTLDRETGEVIRQLPREEVLRMRTDGRYDAGAVIDTQA